MSIYSSKWWVDCGKSTLAFKRFFTSKFVIKHRWDWSLLLSRRRHHQLNGLWVIRPVTLSVLFARRRHGHSAAAQTGSRWHWPSHQSRASRGWAVSSSLPFAFSVPGSTADWDLQTGTNGQKKKSMASSIPKPSPGKVVLRWTHRVASCGGHPNPFWGLDWHLINLIVISHLHSCSDRWIRWGSPLVAPGP